MVVKRCFDFVDLSCLSGSMCQFALGLLDVDKHSSFRGRSFASRNIYIGPAHRSSADGRHFCCSPVSFWLSGHDAISDLRCSAHKAAADAIWFLPESVFCFFGVKAASRLLVRTFSLVNHITARFQATPLLGVYCHVPFDSETIVRVRWYIRGKLLFFLFMWFKNFQWFR